MTVTIGVLLVILSATLVLLQPTLLNPLRKMPPKPKLNVHNFPRPPLLEKTSRHLQVKWRDQIIADTKDAYWVLETTHPPSMPFPLHNTIKVKKDLKQRFFVPDSVLSSPHSIHLSSLPLPPHLLLRMERPRDVLELAIPQRRQQRGRPEQGVEL